MSIRNYNAFLREVKKKHGVSQRKAQEVYRRTRDRLGRSAKGTDVKKHPRIVTEAVKDRRSGNRGKAKGSGKHVKPNRGIIRSIAEWRQVRLDSGGETVQVVSSADYGRKRGRR